MRKSGVVSPSLRNLLKRLVLISFLFVITFCIFKLHSETQSKPISKHRSHKKGPRLAIIKIGNPKEYDKIAGLTVGNTIEYARKLWGAEDERYGEQAGFPTSYVWYVKKDIYLFVRAFVNRCVKRIQAALLFSCIKTPSTNVFPS